MAARKNPTTSSREIAGFSHSIIQDKRTGSGPAAEAPCEQQAGGQQQQRAGCWDLGADVDGIERLRVISTRWRTLPATAVVDR
jgi:hypothetical protein